MAQDPPHVVIETEDVGRNVKLLDRDSKQVDLLMGVIDLRSSVVE